ncbi:MAG: glycosyltransferase [Nanoarchaeota archaeon]|nr:glycosyltransferase [Nanoarchaeota archaeon]MBU1051271.1 glycosyltransferase [Nanoarchaeota archaeon]
MKKKERRGVEMKRIFIVQNTPLGAPLPLSVYLTDLLRNIKKSGTFEINLIVGKSKNVPSEIKKLCKKIYQLKSSTYSIKDNIKFSFEVRSILKREHDKNAIDIVHCLYPNSSLLGGVLFKAFHNKNVKLVYDIRSPWIDMSIGRGFINKKVVPLYRWALYSEERFLCRFVDQFIFITEGLREYYEDVCRIRRKQKIAVSPSGIDTKKFRNVKSNTRSKHGIKKNDVLIGSIGGIAKIRKLDEFLDIFKKVVEKNKKVKLMFVGEGDALTDLKKRVMELDLVKNVVFVGNVEHKDVPKIIAACDFGLCHLPNIFIYENSVPLKILEYLSCEVPVLVSELKTHREMSKKLKGVYVYKNASDVLKFVAEKRGRVKANLEGYDWRDIAKVYDKVWRGL